MWEQVLGFKSASSCFVCFLNVQNVQVKGFLHLGLGLRLGAKYTEKDWPSNALVS